MRFFIGILGVLAGLIMVVYSERVFNITGRWGWAERHFMSGGTRTGIKVVGILCTIVFIIYMTGTLENVLRWIFSPFIGGGFYR